MLKRVDDARSATVLAQDALIAAQERYNQTFAKEIRLRKQLDQNDRKASKAVVVKERSIAEQEAEEFIAELDIPSFELLPWDDRLLLSPSGWESFNRRNFVLNLFEIPNSQPDAKTVVGASSNL